MDRSLQLVLMDSVRDVAVKVPSPADPPDGHVARLSRRQHLAGPRPDLEQGLSSSHTNRSHDTGELRRSTPCSRYIKCPFRVRQGPLWHSATVSGARRLESNPAACKVWARVLARLPASDSCASLLLIILETLHISISGVLGLVPPSPSNPNSRCNCKVVSRDQISKSNGAH
jgi:hypothetical protein